MCLFIQGDSGGKINVLGAYSIGHCEKKKFTLTVSTSEWFTDIQLFARMQKHYKWY